MEDKMETLFKLTNNGTSSNWQNPINSLKLECELIDYGN